MKDALGHGSDPKGGPAHQSGIEQVASLPGKPTAVKIGANKAGEKIALIAETKAIVNADRTISYRPSFGVYIKKANYDGKVRGGLRHTWRYIKKDLTRDEAESVFARRTASGVKA